MNSEHAFFLFVYNNSQGKWINPGIKEIYPKK